MKFKTLRKVALTTCMVLFVLTITVFATSDITPYAIECGNCRTGVILPYSKQVGRTDTFTSQCVYNCTYTEVKGTIEKGERCSYCPYSRVISSTYKTLSSSHSRVHN